jgi:PAS domain S-box-containing protein
MSKFSLMRLLDNSLGLRIIAVVGICQIAVFAALLQHDASLVEQALTDAFALRIESLKPLLNATVAPLLMSEDFETLDARLEEIRGDDDIVYLVARDVNDAIVAEAGWNRSDMIPLASRKIIAGAKVFDTFLLVEAGGKKIGTLNFGVSTQKLSSARDDLLNRGALIVGFGVLLIGAIQVWLGYRLTRQLRLLTVASEDIARGRYEITLDETGSGDVARLAKAMNVMTTAIREKIRSLEQSEEHLRLVMVAGSVVPWERDLYENTMRWGDGAGELLGPLPAGRRDFPDLLMLVHAEDRTRLLNSFESAITSGADYSCEVRVRRPDGVELWLAIWGKLVRVGNTKAGVLMGVARNITTVKQYEEEILRLNEALEARVRQRTEQLETAVRKLEEANNQLSSFSYTVAHDLRAPLRAINGFTEIVLRENKNRLDETSVGHLKRAHAGSVRMGLLIDDLLNLARLARHEVKRQDFDLSKLAADTVAMLDKAHPERNVVVKIMPDLIASGDPGLMQILLDNLIGNAWKFTAKVDTAKIEIGAAERDGQTAYYVRDNGAGFDMTYAHKLFVPFQRLHTHKQFEGTGIGLATVKTIVERHGGKVWIESAVDAGTSIFFTASKETVAAF